MKVSSKFTIDFLKGKKVLWIKTLILSIQKTLKQRFQSNNFLNLGGQGFPKWGSPPTGENLLVPYYYQ